MYFPYCCTIRRPLPEQPTNLETDHSCPASIVIPALIRFPENHFSSRKELLVFIIWDQLTRYANLQQAAYHMHKSQALLITGRPFDQILHLHHDLSYIFVVTILSTFQRDWDRETFLPVGVIADHND